MAYDMPDHASKHAQKCIEHQRHFQKQQISLDHVVGPAATAYWQHLCVERRPMPFGLHLGPLAALMARMAVAMRGACKHVAA